MNEIYLISNDGYKDSINLDCYCATNEELKSICLKDFKEYYSDVLIEDVSIHFNERNEKIVVINYYDEWDIKKEYLEIKIYYTFKLDRYVFGN